MSFIRFNELSKIYPINYSALRGISFSINQGEKVAILGPSGSGKSTLLKLLSGLDYPSEGEIIIDGKQHVDLSKEGQIGFVFQDVNSVFPHLSIFNNVAFPLKLSIRKNTFNIEENVTEILRIVGLFGIKEKFPHKLSGGEKQRIAIARALVFQPKIFLLDEPLSSLDNLLKREILDLIARIHQKFKNTILYVTHDEREAFEIADKIAILDDGVLMQYGDTEKVAMDPNNSKVAKIIGHWNIMTAYFEGKGLDLLLVVLNKNIKFNYSKTTNSKPFKVGIRYSSFKIVDNNYENDLDRYSFYGKVTNIYKSTGGYIISVICSDIVLKCETIFKPKVLNINDSIHLGFKLEDVKLWN